MKVTPNLLQGSRSRVLILGAVTAIVLGGVVTASTTIATAAPSGNSATDTNSATDIAVPKTLRPANINPNKSPVLDPSKIKPDIIVPLSVSQQVNQARAWAAQDPNTRLVCFTPDGSVAGMAQLERIDPASPISPSAAIAFCNRATPGSHP